MNGVRKRSVSIRGHRTSFSLEDEFFHELERIAAQDSTALASLVAEVDAAREEGVNLSSALRLHVLQRLRQEAGRAPL